MKPVLIPPLREPPHLKDTVSGGSGARNSNSQGMTDREVLLVAALYATGHRVDVIAQRLGLFPGAVRTTLERVLRPRIT